MTEQQEGKAFRTLDKVNTLDLEPGDTVLLKKGSVFEDQALTFTKEDSGTAEAPVKYLPMERETDHRSIQMVMAYGS